MHDDRLRPHLAIGLACLIVFVALAAIATSSAVTSLDAHVLRAIAVRVTHGTRLVAWQMSRLGNPKGAAVIAAVAIAVLFARARMREATALAIACSGAAFLDLGLKMLVGRPGPHVAYDDSLVPDASFPSGHALGAVALYGMIAYLAGRHAPKRALVSATVALTAVVGIGASRLVLGVHWPTDVVGGYAIGGAWLEACIAGLILSERPRRGAGLSGGPPKVPAES